MSFLHYLSNNKKPGFGGTRGGSQKLQESQKVIKNEWKMEKYGKKGKKNDPKATHPFPKTITKEYGRI